VKRVAIDRDKLEIERLNNLITGFGWRIMKQEFTEDKIKLSLEKDRAPGVEAGGPGAG